MSIHYLTVSGTGHHQINLSSEDELLEAQKLLDDSTQPKGFKDLVIPAYPLQASYVFFPTTTSLMNLEEK